MQLSIRDAAGGEGFRNIMWALGSCRKRWQQRHAHTAAEFTTLYTSHSLTVRALFTHEAGYHT
jgi:hypothetical protein